MKKNFPILNALLVTLMSGLFFSCGELNADKEETKSDKKEVAAPAADAAFIPFKAMVIRHAVTDYSVWKPRYDEHVTIRKDYGLTDLSLMHEYDDTNKLLIVEKINDVAKAKEFTHLQDLVAVMQKAGVTGVPQFEFYDVIRFDDSPVNAKDIVVITHKVKDFDAWVKVYDSEGKETRQKEGMIDKVLARGIDDPNMVHIVFTATDLVKAKEAIYSTAKRNLMMSAGVQGVPKVEFYHLAD